MTAGKGCVILIPLAIRANETKRENARIHDEKAVEIINVLKIDTTNLDKFFSHEGVVARTIMFDNAMKKLLKKYPDAMCVNIGCGLDDRFSRVDNGRIQWFNVDLADSIAIRKKIFQETEREHIITGDVLKADWTEQLPKSDCTIEWQFMNGTVGDRQERNSGTENKKVQCNAAPYALVKLS